MTLYPWLKALHVLAVAVWFGGALAVLGIAGLFSRTTDRHRMAGLAGACDFVGLRLIAPAGGIALLTGLVTVWAGHLPMKFWLWWGLATAVLVMSFGGAVLGRGFRRLAAMLDTPSGQEAEIAALVARLRAAGAVAIAVLASAMLVMVLKPTF